MKIVADLHLHSKYSRAVSQQMVPEFIAQWAKQKGIALVAAPDWTHPLMLKKYESNLQESEEGIFELKSKVKGQGSKVNYVLSTEISSIYSQGEKSRRIHNLVLAPSFKTVHQINKQLKNRGCNLMSDGRPIIGLSSIELAELVWGVDKNCLIIPCHIWTPWFSMFGSKSGFDSIKECWGKYADQICAIETGLSSDPAMNWRIKELDNRSIVSFSDAHSPAKLGREATIFDLEKVTFSGLSNALKTANISYTIEFYPEEGKYHYTGHRSCNIRHSPVQTKKKGAVCPVCGKPLTLGVMHRVEKLAGKQVKPIKKTSKNGLVGYYDPNNKNRPPYVMLVPLQEIISEVKGVGPTSKTVQNEYQRLIKSIAPELDILTQTKIEKIAQFGGERLAQAIKKVRKGDINIEPGYDGVFGNVKIWKEEQTEKIEKQAEQESLF
jgi:uncharacterized protein (TIGR00375 family)